MTAAASTWSARIEAAWLRRGPLACMLWPLSALYRASIELRRLFYRAGWKHSCSLPVPVVVVGNLIAGGAGKTPTTLALVQLLRQHGFTPGIVSRGYGRQARHIVDVTGETSADDAGDEPLMMRRRSGAPVMVGRDRIAAGRELLRCHPEVDLVVSDDGLQHLRLDRDVQVIVFDERGIGNGWLLPAGPLRESFRPRPPRGSLVVYNAPAPSTPWPGHVARRRLGDVVRLSDWWAGARRSPLNNLAQLRAQSLWAAAGVARPNRFFDMLRAAGLNATELPLPDHCDFKELPWPLDAEAVIVTEKDAVKLQLGRPGTAGVWVATLDFDLGADFETALLQQVALARRQKISASRDSTPAPP